MSFNRLSFDSGTFVEGTPIVMMGEPVSPAVLSVLRANGIEANRVGAWLHDRSRQPRSACIAIACGPDRGVILVDVRNPLDRNAMSMRTAEAAALAARLGWRRPWLLVCANSPSADLQLAAIDGLAMATYCYVQDRPDTGRRIGDIWLCTAEPNDAFLDRAEAHVAAMTLVRDLVMMPANLLGPADFAERLSALTVLGMDFTAYTPEELGMGALAAVGAGSGRSPLFGVLRYDGTLGAAPPVALIGKGLCFDAGGTSAKPARGLWRMKGDMAGAAAVAGAMLDLALSRAVAHVVALFPLAENLSGGTAIRPGDVVVSRSGTRIEVLDTDYEGRLVLADALDYAATIVGARTCVSVATLSQTVVDTLGPFRAGFFANDEQLADALLRASEQSGERLWRLPLSDDLDGMMQTDVADIRNMPDHDLGAPCYAARFLQQFVGSMVWGHVEIMGPAFAASAVDPRFPVWATGFGARLLSSWLTNDRQLSPV